MISAAGTAPSRQHRPFHHQPRKPSVHSRHQVSSPGPTTSGPRCRCKPAADRQANVRPCQLDELTPCAASSMNPTVQDKLRPPMGERPCCPHFTHPCVALHRPMAHSSAAATCCCRRRPAAAPAAPLAAALLAAAAHHDKRPAGRGPRLLGGGLGGGGGAPTRCPAELLLVVDEHLGAVPASKNWCQSSVNREQPDVRVPQRNIQRTMMS